MKRELLFAIVLISLIGIASAAIDVPTSNTEATVCCEKTITNLYCQQVPEGQCAPGATKAPTACSSTSFCKPGICYSNKEGNCMENTPKVVCNTQNASWSAKRGPECELGCCLLGDQAAFVSLVRCKRLSSFLGLETNYKKTITSEAVCILQTLNQDKGACVYSSEFENSCKFTTREDCSANVKGSFYKNKLCTAAELNTVCGKTTKTTCLEGKEDVYFIDTCGNTANVYDANKKDDLNYWTDYIVDQTQLCGAGSSDGSANSKSCGNCNYLDGSICRPAASGSKPTYGDNICKGLNCDDIGKKHGESWCEYTDAGKKDIGQNSVGSRYFKHTCQNGEETVEPCADFRQEECIEDNITSPTGYKFSQAACRVNRWQDCLTQTTSKDCTNTDKRDCIWRDYSLFDVCIPKNPPGRAFWNSDEAKSVCAIASGVCNITYEMGLFDDDKDAKCIDNCDCEKTAKDQGTWVKNRVSMCTSLGDCGYNVNWANAAGYDDASETIRTGFSKS